MIYIKNTKLFFTIEGLEWDELLKMHKILAKAPDKEVCELFGEEFDATKKDKRVPKDDVLLKKYEFFLHNLIKRQIASDSGVVIAAISLKPLIMNSLAIITITIHAAI